MTDEKDGDPYRQHTTESGTTTPGARSTKGQHAEEGDVGGQKGQTGQSDQGGNTGALGNTGSSPDWMQAQRGKGGDQDRQEDDANPAVKPHEEPHASSEGQ